MPSEHIGLDLFALRANAGAHASILATLVDRLVQCIGANALDAGELEGAEFKKHLEIFRATLAAGPEPAALEAAAAQCLQRCDAYFANFHEYLIARDVEFGETIDLLRTALSRLAGDSKGVNEALDESARKLRSLNDLSDIRHMRRELSRAVLDLEAAVEERKKVDRASHERLAQQVTALESKVEESMAEALKDALTGVANRRSFDEAIRRWSVRANRSGEPFALALVDLDDFKRVNDEHGHSIGDRILMVAARCLRNAVRGSDYVARYGGEEFVVMLRNIDSELAKQRMTEALRTIADARYEYHGVGRRIVVSVSASCGVADYVPGETVDQLVARADSALYEAKSGGKKHVVVASGGPNALTASVAS